MRADHFQNRINQAISLPFIELRQEGEILDPKTLEFPAIHQNMGNFPQYFEDSPQEPPRHPETSSHSIVLQSHRLPDSVELMHMATA